MTPGTAPAGGDALARVFEAQRPRLVRVAYATVGSVAEAEDCVQEAWLRLRRVEDPAGIRNLGAWLTTTVSRLALDALGRAQVRREGRPRFPPTYAEQRELVAAFAAACTEGDLERLVTLLDPDVVWRGDGGGKVASGLGTQGAELVARALVLLTRRPPRRLGTATVNGAPGLVVVDADGVLSVISFTVDGGRITAIDVVRNPDKLSGAREPG